MTPGLERKVDFAIKLLRSIPDDGPIEVSYSGGKDSDVILELAKMAGINYRAIYKQTSIDHPGCTAHAKENGAEIIRPKETFFELIRRKGTPTRYARFCCGVLKEHKVLDRAVLGIRRSESAKRKERYKEPELCRSYRNGEKAKIYLPILEWTNGDVTEFIAERKIRCHPLYYRNGAFDATQRLGCIGCPLASQKKRRAEFLQYPKILRLWIKNLQIFLDSHPHSKASRTFAGNAANKMFYELFCSNTEEYDVLIYGGLFPEQATDAKNYLENYFKIKL